ncbi:DUF5908 family protein [Pelobacter propionicus]|uniref:DUF5908 family protein n=1 Tax=Pelobacter propionicus TaxID=29543 RepID=UPI000312EAAE|nr:DUF5908 family protein [Pelobacter propionicus]
MTIEVRQMTIRCAVQADNGSGRTKGFAPGRLEELKSDVIEECRQMIRDMLNARRER